MATVIVSFTPVERFFQKRGISGAPEGSTHITIIVYFSFHIIELQTIFLLSPILARSFL
jgi:hypothetical protein